MGGYGMQSATFLIKPASSLCNMRCHYCFYHNISNICTTSSMGFMSEDTAKSIIQAAFDAVESGGFVQFTFLGGEPTLASLDFFRSFLALETQLLTKDITVGHSIQTNGLHLNDDWAEFLKRHNFLVGVSIDGCPPHICVYVALQQRINRGHIQDARSQRYQDNANLREDAGSSRV